VFPVRCGLKSYILFRRNSVFKGVNPECYVPPPDPFRTKSKSSLILYLNMISLLNFVPISFDSQNRLI
jgi:hypothetical protein